MKQTYPLVKISIGEEERAALSLKWTAKMSSNMSIAQGSTWHAAMTTISGPGAMSVSFQMGANSTDITILVWNLPALEISMSLMGRILFV
jgi:hypothetical protein